MRSPSHDRAPRALLALALLPGIALDAWYLLSSARLAGAIGFPLDDSWIHAQFARSLASGDGFVYTGTDWVAGSTAPLWTVLLAALYAVTRSMTASAIVLGGAAQMAAGYYAVRLTQALHVPPTVAVLAATLVVVLPVTAWGAVAGMEVNLAAALVLAGLYYYFQTPADAGPRRYAGVALLGASALARPENMALLSVVLLGDLLFAPGPRRARVARAAAGALVGVLAIVPLVALSYATIGRPLPTTFYAKSGPGLVRALQSGDRVMLERNLLSSGPDAVVNMELTVRDQFSWSGYLALPALVVLAAIRSTRRIGLTLAAILVLVPFAMGVTAPQRLKPDNVRYAAQLVVLLGPILVAALWHAWRRPLQVLVLAGLLAIPVAARAAGRADGYAQSVKNIQELHVAAGRWIAGHLPPGALVAANDVGAIAYFGERRILDLEGLVTPEVLPYRQFPDRGLRVVQDMRPDYIVIFPGWYPDISTSPEFQEVHRFSIADNYISAGDTLVVYRPPWTADR